jgi:hypothetical protein
MEARKQTFLVRLYLSEQNAAPNSHHKWVFFARIVPFGAFLTQICVKSLEKGKPLQNSDDTLRT